MIRSLTTLMYGVVVAALIIVVAVFAAVWILGMATKAALFGEPRASLVMKALQRASEARHQEPAVVTHTTPDTGEEQ